MYFATPESKAEQVKEELAKLSDRELLIHCLPEVRKSLAAHNKIIADGSYDDMATSDVYGLQKGYELAIAEIEKREAEFKAPKTPEITLRDAQIELRLSKVVSEQLTVPIERVTMDKKFVADLGADSLDLVEIVMALEDEFGIEIPDNDAEGITDMKAAHAYLALHYRD